MTCAFGDCGNPHCHLCALARIQTRKVEGKAADGIRDDAKPELKEKRKEKPIWMPKKKHRVGPHR